MMSAAAALNQSSAGPPQPTIASSCPPSDTSSNEVDLSLDELLKSPSHPLPSDEINNNSIRLAKPRLSANRLSANVATGGDGSSHNSPSEASHNTSKRDKSKSSRKPWYSVSEMLFNVCWRTVFFFILLLF